MNSVFNSLASPSGTTIAEIVSFYGTQALATHDGKNLTSVSALKTPPKTTPFPQYFKTKGSQFSRVKGPCSSLYQ